MAPSQKQRILGRQWDALRPGGSLARSGRRQAAQRQSAASTSESGQRSELLARLQAACTLTACRSRRHPSPAAGCASCRAQGQSRVRQAAAETKVLSSLDIAAVLPARWTQLHQKVLQICVRTHVICQCRRTGRGTANLLSAGGNRRDVIRATLRQICCTQDLEPTMFCGSSIEEGLRSLPTAMAQQVSRIRRTAYCEAVQNSRSAVQGSAVQCRA